MNRPFSKTMYESLIQMLDSINKEENPCQFDEQWKCIASRLWKILWDSCCTKSCWTVCSNLWATVCTTTNILCKTFYCTTAQNNLSQSSKYRIDRIEDFLFHLLWSWDKKQAIKFFYQKEKVIKQKLFPKK